MSFDLSDEYTSINSLSFLFQIATWKTKKIRNWKHMYVVFVESLLRSSFNLAACNFFNLQMTSPGFYFLLSESQEHAVTRVELRLGFGAWSKVERGWRVGMAEGRYG